MSDETRHALIVCILIFCLLLFGVLLFLEPVIGLLWLAVAVFGFILSALIRPQIWQKEKEYLRNHYTSGKKPGDDDSRSTEFSPDHMLISLDGEHPVSYLVDSTDFVIGRGTECNLVLTDDSTVSTKHCRIRYRKFSQDYYVEDLHSMNGTYMGTRRLVPNKQEKLLDGAELSISSYKFRFSPCQR